jgi:hypothetical protein
MKSSVQTALIWVFLLFVTAASVTGYIKEQGKSKRLLYDLKAAQETAKTFTTKDGHQASKLIAQELTAGELKKVNPQIVSQLKNMYIPPRLAQSYTEASQTMQVEVKATVKDSIPARTENNPDAREPEKIKVLKFRDKWISISGIVDPDTAKIMVLAKDTIFTAIYKGERRHPWAWILSKRQLTAAATNRSPYIKINVIQSGVIKK